MIWHFVEVFVLVLLFAAISESGFTSANLSFASQCERRFVVKSRGWPRQSPKFSGQLVDLYQVNSSLYKNENVIPVTPYSGFLTIQQGVSEGQRLGNKVNMKSVRLRLGIWPKQYDATTNPNPRPCMVRCWLVSMKTGVGATKDYMTDIVQSYFLQGTTGSNAGLSGCIMILYPRQR